jgi:hypothetical protein
LKETGDRYCKRFEESLSLQLVEKPPEGLSGCPAERCRRREGLGTGNGDKEVEGVSPADLPDGIGQIIEILKLLAVFRTP